MDSDLLSGAYGVPVVIALVEAVKMMFPDLPSRWYPAVALATALLWALIAWYWGLGAALKDALIYGILAGLSAMGLYSGTKAVIGK